MSKRNVFFADNVDVILQPYGSFICKRFDNMFDVLNRTATGMLLKLVSGKKCTQYVDGSLVHTLKEKGYLTEGQGDNSNYHSMPNIHFLSERDILKAVRAEIEITNRCNLKCAYCYAEVNKSKIELSEGVWKDLLMGMYQHGLRAVLFSGGEPFIRRDFVSLVSWAAERFIVEINSNGYYITDSVAKELGRMNLKVVQISLDSVYKDHHDSIRGKRSHENAVNAIKTLVRNGVPVQISCVVTKSNRDQLGDLADFARELGAVLKADPVTRTGFAKKIDDKEWQKYYQVSSDDRVQSNKVGNALNEFTPMCQSQIGYVAVSHVGLLKPCNMREGFFEPVGSGVFEEMDSKWWNRHYGETKLGKSGSRLMQISEPSGSRVDKDGRYLCALQANYVDHQSRNNDELKVLLRQ